MSIYVVVESRVAPENIEKMKVFVKEILPGAREFAGCQSIAILQNIDEPENFIWHEIWESREHYQQYLKWREETGILKKMNELRESGTHRYFRSLEVSG